MRLYKVVILVNLALALGLLAGYFWWEREVDRLTRELAVAKQAGATRQGTDRRWTIRGIVRGAAPTTNQLMVTHGEIPGLMGPMTMSFRTDDPSLLQGLTAGDRIQFTLTENGKQLTVVALRKEGSR